MRQVPGIKQLVNGCFNMQPKAKKYLFCSLISLLGITLSLGIFLFYKNTLQPSQINKHKVDQHNKYIIDQRSHLLSKDHFYVIHLYGSNQQMGYAYGKLLQKQLNSFSSSIINALEIRQQMPRAKKIAAALYQHYPQRWQQFLQAMAKGAKLPLEKILITNGFEHYAIFNHVNKVNSKSRPTVFGCAELFSSHKTSSNKGKNQYQVMRWYDYFNGHPEWRNKLLITVFHGESKNNRPAYPKHRQTYMRTQAQTQTQVAMITYLGTLNATTLINNHNLFLALNNGRYSALRMNKKYQAMDYHFSFSTIQLLDMFFKARNLNQLKQIMTNHKVSTALIYSVLDSAQHQVLSYEVVPGIKKLLHPKTNQPWAVTNNFQDHSWSKYETRPKLANKDASNTYARKANLDKAAKLFNKRQSPLSEASAESFLRSSIAEGGASSNSTVMQLFFNPNAAATDNNMSSNYLAMRVPPNGEFVTFSKNNIFNNPA